MRRVKSTRRFQRDFRKLRRGEHASHIEDTLLTALKLLSADAVLPDRYTDHQMKGEYRDCRDCHLRGDLVLIYRKTGEDILELVRIGSHASLEL